MPRLPHTKAHATFRRTIRLLASFRHEQTNPDQFYEPLAADTAAQIQALAADHSQQVSRVLDVGGGPGYFASQFDDYVSVDPDPTSAANVRSSGESLPFPDATFDVVFSSNVAEHVARPWVMADEMVRVVKPGGLVVLSYTVWLGPFGGHETGLLPHYVGGEYALRRYIRKHGRAPKNIWGESLFAVSCRDGLRWAAKHPGAVAIPRYHPRWAWWIVRVPGLRELLTSNLLIAWQKPADM